MSYKNRVLTGDTPTGKLHLGHWVGSLENRLMLQEQFESFFIIANTHAFTTQYLDPAKIKENTTQIAIDYLAVGIDPNKSYIFIQSEIPAIAELTFLFSMLVSTSRILRNPTIKSEIQDKKLSNGYPFGFLLYPIGQVADILAIRANLVPVGEDQIPHLELTREVARTFNQTYCGVDPKIPDQEHYNAGGIFRIPEPKLGRVKRLVGIGPPDQSGKLLKMSKSLGNAIFLSDSPDQVKQKIMQMYTDPKRIKASDPGEITNNPLWILHRAFNPDQPWLELAQDQYKNGQIGDVACKHKLIEVLNDFLTPFRNNRKIYERDPKMVYDILLHGTAKANEIAEQTLDLVKQKINQNYFTRQLHCLSKEP